MASAAVKTAVESRVAGWSQIAAYPFVDENDVANSPQKQFLSIEYPVANEDRISVGLPGLFRESGGIRFVIHILNLSGLNAAIADVDTLRDLFRDKTFDGVVTFEAAPAAFDKGNRNGAFYLLPFVVTYHFDIIR